MGNSCYNSPFTAILLVSLNRYLENCSFTNFKDENAKYEITRRAD